MRITTGLFIGVIAVFAFQNGCFAQEGKWRQEKSTHFIVNYKKAPEDFVRQLSEKAEELYNKIADDLGFRRFDFWLWDNRAKIYIYDDAADYRQSTGQPAWSAGSAMPREKIIYTYPFAKGFFETVLPHEMGHIIFREFVGFQNYAVPLWFEEGVACYQENIRNPAAKEILKASVSSGTFISIDKLAVLNPQLIADDALVQLFYIESASIVDFLIKEFGKDNFVLFCQNLRDKKNFEKAICSVYPFADLKELGQAWEKNIKK